VQLRDGKLDKSQKNVGEEQKMSASGCLEEKQLESVACLYGGIRNACGRLQNEGSGKKTCKHVKYTDSRILVSTPVGGSGGVENDGV
jgi:hypothetical protein